MSNKNQSGHSRKDRIDDILTRVIRFSDRHSIGVLLFLPFLILLTIFGIPIIANTIMSFFQWNGTGLPSNFVGLSNYVSLLDISVIQRSLTNTAIWTLVVAIIPPTIGLGIALLINGHWREGTFRAAFFIPYTISFVAIGITWRLVYHADFGILNSFLGLIGLESLAQPWLGMPTVNTIAMMIAKSWQFGALAIVIYAAGLQSIPRELIEATKMDGLSRFQRFRYVTLPLLRPFTTLIVATILFNVVKVFTVIWVMTGGGPYFTSETLAVTMYRLSFTEYRFGKGAAIANVLTLLVVVVTVVYIQYNIRKEVEY